MGSMELIFKYLHSSHENEKMYSRSISYHRTRVWHKNWGPENVTPMLLLLIREGRGEWQHFSIMSHKEH